MSLLWLKCNSQIRKGVVSSNAGYLDLWDWFYTEGLCYLLIFYIRSPHPEILDKISAAAIFGLDSSCVLAGAWAGRYWQGCFYRLLVGVDFSLSS